jgi:adenylate cyclase
VTSFSPDDVKAQLKLILASPEFSSSQRISQFLGYVVMQTLKGQSGDIKQYTIAVDGMGFGAGFDPQSNPTVRIHARKLRRALDRYYLKQGIADPIRIDIPKGSYVPIFSDSPIASKASDSTECHSPAAAQTPLDSSKPSIAVIMFDCLNAKDEFGYVATGLTEEIIIALTLFPDFLVVGPLSRGFISSQDLDARSIGQQYGVRFVLDGTIRLNGQKIRLMIRLADTISGRQLWGQALDCGLQNGSILESENNVVDQVVATIADSYGVIPRTLTNESLTRRTDSPKAYEAILHYYHYFRVLTQESYVDAMNALEKTVRHYPDQALAMAALGDLVATTYMFGYEEDESLLVRAESLGRKALALDPNCQPARFTMAFIHFLKFQRSLFMDEVEQCLQLNPNNAHFLAVLSLHVGMVGEWDRAMKLMGKAMRLNPHHPGWYHIVAFMNSYRQGEYDLALIEARRFNTPEFFWDPLIRAAVLGQLDRRAEAEKAVDELLALVPDFNLRGWSLIRRLAFLDEHVEMLLEGLRRAGLETKSKVIDAT